MAKDALTPVPRNELLKTGGEFTFSQLIDFGLGPPERDYSRASLLVSEIMPVRPLPSALMTSAKRFYGQESDPYSLFTYINNGFEIYRNVAGRDPFTAPLIVHKEAAEFPEPVRAAWEDRDAVSFLGMLSGAFDQPPPSTLWTQVGSMRTATDLGSGDVTEKELLEMQAFPQNTVRFRIPALADVRMISAPAWQKWALRGYASALQHAIADLKKGTAQRAEIEKLIAYLFTEVDHAYDLPVLRYAKEGEKTNSANMFIPEF